MDQLVLTLLARTLHGFASIPNVLSPSFVPRPRPFPSHSEDRGRLTLHWVQKIRESNVPSDRGMPLHMCTRSGPCVPRIWEKRRHRRREKNSLQSPWSSEGTVESPSESTYPDVTPSASVWVSVREYISQMASSHFTNSSRRFCLCMSGVSQNVTLGSPRRRRLRQSLIRPLVVQSI